MPTSKIRHPPSIENNRLVYTSASALSMVGECEQRFYLSKVEKIKEPEGPWQKVGVEAHAGRAWWLTKGQNRLPGWMLDTLRYPPKPGKKTLRVELGFDGRRNRDTAFDAASSAVRIMGVPFDGFIDAEWISRHPTIPHRQVGHVQDLKTKSDVQKYALRKEDLPQDVQMLIYGHKLFQDYPNLAGVWLRHLYAQTPGRGRGKLVVEVKEFVTKVQILTGLEKHVYPLLRRALYIATFPKGLAKEIPRTGVKTGFCHKYGKGCYYAGRGCKRTEDEVFESLLNAGKQQDTKPKRLLLGSSDDADYIDVQPKPAKKVKTVAIADKKGVVRCEDCGKLLTREGTPGKNYTHKGCAFTTQKVLSSDAAPPDETKKSAKAIAKAKEAAAAEVEEDADEDEEEFSPVPPPRKKAKAVVEEAEEEEDAEVEETEETEDEGDDTDEAEETEETEEADDEDAEEEADEAEESDDEEEVEEAEEEPDEDAEEAEMPEKPTQPAKRGRGRPPKSGVKVEPKEIVTSPGFVLYIDPKRIPKQSIDLTAWCTKCAKALASQYKVKDVRIPAGSDHPLSFGRWKGRLAALVAQAPKPSGTCVIFTNGDFSQVIAEELAAHASQVVHGA